MNKFNATIEFLSGQKAAIITLTNINGDWAGACRIQGSSKSDLYERGYVAASLSATNKDGRLETFRVL